MVLGPAVARRAVRRVGDRALDWVDDHDPAKLFMVATGFLLIVGTSVFVMVATFHEPAAESTLGVPPHAERTEPTRAEYTNLKGGYSFAYPSSWEIRDAGMLTRLENPNGDIVVSFRPEPSGPLETASTQLMASLAPAAANRELIGTRWDRIGGSRSLLASGIGTDETGRPVRFLAIAIRGERLNYGISVVVPADSSASRVLPRLEEIVSSFKFVEMNSY